MKFTNSNRQVVLFGNFNQIDSTSTSIKILTPILEKYDLNFATSQDVSYFNLSLNGIPNLLPVNRPFLYKEGSPLSVRFSAQRIDIQCVNSELSEDDLFIMICDIVKIIQDGYSLKFNRLAYNGVLTVSEITDEEVFKKCYNKFFKNSKLSNAKEWSLRILDNIYDKATGETFNRIATNARKAINRDINNPLQKEDVLVHSFDINTPFEKMDYRFTFVEFEKFINSAKILKQKMIEDFKGLFL